MTDSRDSLRVVGIDTATRSGGVALVERAAGTITALAEVAHDEDLRHAETLLPAIDRCLEQAGGSLADVDGYAVSIGPGSFTGLRVGLATAKGLAFATGAWIVGVPTLAAYASACGTDCGAAGAPVWVCLDARKGEVYSALFVVHADRVERLLDDAVEGPAAAAARVRACLEAHRARAWSTLRVVGDGTERYAGETVDAATHLEIQSALVPPEGRGRAVALLGVERYLREGPADTAYLAPAYLRASEAELKLREPQAARDSR